MCRSHRYAQRPAWAAPCALIDVRGAIPDAGAPQDLQGFAITPLPSSRARPSSAAQATTPTGRTSALWRFPRVDLARVDEVPSAIERPGSRERPALPLGSGWYVAAPKGAGRVMCDPWHKTLYLRRWVVKHMPQMFSSGNG